MTDSRTANRSRRSGSDRGRCLIQHKCPDEGSSFGAVVDSHARVRGDAAVHPRPIIHADHLPRHTIEGQGHDLAFERPVQVSLIVRQVLVVPDQRAGLSSTAMLPAKAYAGVKPAGCAGPAAAGGLLAGLDFVFTQGRVWDEPIRRTS